MDRQEKEVVVIRPANITIPLFRGIVLLYNIRQSLTGVIHSLKKSAVFLKGMRDGIPVGAGYLAVAFSLGIAARAAGLNAAEGFFASLFTIASAGEYAGFRVIASGGTYPEMAAVILVANCRYLLMSCALAQKAPEGMKALHRVGVGFFITDELFGLNIARPGHLEPSYAYGAALTSVLPWAIGTSLGITAGNLLSASLVSALSVALYGMFLAIIIPPARGDRVIMGAVAASFLLSWASSVLPVLRELSEGTRIIILTLVIASFAAAVFPVREEEAS